MLPEKQKKSDTLLPSWWRVKPTWGDGSGSSPWRYCKKRRKKKQRSKLPSQVWVKRCHTDLWLSNKKKQDDKVDVRSYTALRVQDASLRRHVDVSPSTTQMIMNKCCPHTVSPLIISSVASRFTTERFLLCASGGEERLGGLRGRRRGYGSFRKEINNKPPAARPQTAWIILRLINWLLHGRPCQMKQPLHDKVINCVHDDSTALLCFAICQTVRFGPEGGCRSHRNSQQTGCYNMRICSWPLWGNPAFVTLWHTAARLSTLTPTHSAFSFTKVALICTKPSTRWNIANNNKKTHNSSLEVLNFVQVFLLVCLQDKHCIYYY